MPASLRSDGVLVHPGKLFGIIPEFAFGFVGIPFKTLMKTKRLSRRSRAFYTLLMSAAPMARKSRRAEFDAGVRAAYRGFSSVAESEKKRPLREAPYRLGFILIDFEQGVDLGDLQHLSYLFC